MPESIAWFMAGVFTACCVFLAVAIGRQVRREMAEDELGADAMGNRRW